MRAHDPSKEGQYFSDAVVEVGDRSYSFSIADGRAIESAGNYWHGPGDPSTWLIVAVFLQARQRVGAAGDSIALELAARALGLTVERVRNGIEWHEQYMQWHDGDPDYKVL